MKEHEAEKCAKGKNRLRTDIQSLIPSGNDRIEELF